MHRRNEVNAEWRRIDGLIDVWAWHMQVIVSQQSWLLEPDSCTAPVEVLEHEGTTSRASLPNMMPTSLVAKNKKVLNFW
jgi:hypothetical protein